MNLPRFRLRTMFVAVAVLAVPMAWVAYQLEWIRQRRHSLTISGVVYAGEQDAPGTLWLFGERGYGAVIVGNSSSLTDHIDEVRRLFPEAEIWELDKSDNPVPKKYSPLSRR